MSTPNPNSDSSKENAPAKDPIWKRLWKKSGLSPPIMKLMVKGALPPVIALALFQQTGFADTYTTIGYLVAIVTVLGLAFQPRAKYLQSLLFSLIAICVGACLALLTCYSAVKAREHTTVTQTQTSTGPTTGSPTVQYNSSASAVSAVWLFFSIMFANAFRFKWPQLQIPVIIFSIYANIASIYAPQFPTMATAEAFVQKLLLAFVTGFGISTVISLLIFPMTSRKIVHAKFAAYLGAVKGILGAEKAYLQSMEAGDLEIKQRKDGKVEDSPIAASTKKLKASIAGLTGLHSSLAAELAFAKREIAYGKLGAKDMDALFKLLRHILLPCLGLTSVADIFERVAEGQGWSEEPVSPAQAQRHSSDPRWLNQARVEKSEWNEIMVAVHDPFQELVEAMTEGLTHVGIALEFTPKPKGKNATPNKPESPKDTSSDDVEAKAGSGSAPGDHDFRIVLAARIDRFAERNKEALRGWCRSRGLDINDLDSSTGGGLPCPSQDRKHLFMILYMEFLLFSTARAVQALVQFADEKVESGAMSKRRLILPGTKRLKKWFISCFVPDEGQSSQDSTPDQAEGGSRYVNTGDAFKQKRDPEHLPPTTWWQHFGEYLHKIGRMFQSVEVVFGFRVACATMTVAIIGYVEPTANFFISQRLFWAQIMVAISMSVTSGSGVFGFVARVIGTLFACCLSLVLWYISGGRGIPGALLPLLFLAYLPLFWCFFNYPRFIPAWIVSIVTTVLILGYELEADKLGITALESNGQAYHPIYVFAWIRLATVTGGLAIAFIWTYFPYPITAKNTMRMRLGDALYMLASYYSCIHTTVGFRISGTGGTQDEKGSPIHQLQKARFRHIYKILALLEDIRGHLNFSKFEISVGGKFPREQYEKIITEVNNIFNYMSLIDYATAAYVYPKHPAHSNNNSQEDITSPTGNHDGDGEELHRPMTHQTWLQDLARIRSKINVTSREITSVLALMASSIKHGQPLPPYMQPPRPFELAQRIEAIDPEILSVRHVTEHGYAAFAVTQVASRLISHDMARLLENVKSLVGEVDFSFHPLEKGMKVEGHEGGVKGKNE